MLLHLWGGQINDLNQATKIPKEIAETSIPELRTVRHYNTWKYLIYEEEK